MSWTTILDGRWRRRSRRHRSRRGSGDRGRAGDVATEGGAEGLIDCGDRRFRPHRHRRQQRRRPPVGAVRRADGRPVGSSRGRQPPRDVPRHARRVAADFEAGLRRIVSTTSNSGLLGVAGSSAYAAAKAAIWGLTRSLAIEGEPRDPRQCDGADRVHRDVGGVEDRATGVEERAKETTGRGASTSIDRTCRGLALARGLRPQRPGARAPPEGELPASAMRSPTDSTPTHCRSRTSATASPSCSPANRASSIGRPPKKGVTSTVASSRADPRTRTRT